MPKYIQQIFFPDLFSYTSNRINNFYVDSSSEISISENIHNKMNCNCVSRLDFRYSEENEKILEDGGNVMRTKAGREGYWNRDVVEKHPRILFIYGLFLESSSLLGSFLVGLKVKQKSQVL